MGATVFEIAAFKGVSNALQNFTFMGATVFEIAALVKGVGTKKLGKGMANYKKT